MESKNEMPRRDFLAATAGITLAGLAAGGVAQGAEEKLAIDGGAKAVTATSPTLAMDTSLGATTLMRSR